MKIIYTLASLGSGGAERVVCLLANKMNEMGHEVEIICLKYDDVYYQTNDSIKVVCGKGQAKNNLSALLKLLEEGKEESIVIARNGKPVAKMVAYAPVDVSKRIGIAKNSPLVVDDWAFDELDDYVAELFEESLDEPLD